MPNKEQNSPYIAKTGSAAKDRLALQHIVFAPGTEILLNMAAFKRNMSILVIGCGCGDETIMIAEKMDASGRIVAIDISSEQIQEASKKAEKKGLKSKISFLTKSIYDLDKKDGEYDLILCRFVIPHLPDPEKAIRILKGCLREGGVIAAQEPIVTSCRSEPASPALTRYIGLMKAFGEKTQRDFDMAKTIPDLFEKCELKTQSQEWQPKVFGKSKLMVTMSASECIPALEKVGLISKADGSALVDAINKEVVDQKDVVLFQCINVLVVGQK